MIRIKIFVHIKITIKANASCQESKGYMMLKNTSIRIKKYRRPIFNLIIT